MRVSVLCFDLTNNSLGRAYLLAKVLRRSHEVEVYGSLFRSHGPTVWKPCDTGEFDYRIVEGCKFPRYLGSIKSLLSRLSGDVIYACKPRLPSYGVALLKRLFAGRRVVLDIDDLETSWYGPEDWRPLRRVLRNPVGPLYTRWMEKLVARADAITTVSTQLQQRFGGTIVPHGRDTAWLDPDRQDGAPLRRELGLERARVIVFLGTPRPHKGLEDLIGALGLLQQPDIKLLIVGAGSDPSYERRLVELGGEQVRLVPQIPILDVPRYLSVADLVVIPQRRAEQAHGQIPAKLFDAMAMARPIIATTMSDLPAILDGCGLLVEPEDGRALADRIDWVFTHQAEAREMGRRARTKCIAEYSLDVMAERLAPVVAP
jgi:glycosyltransferase involved in cell wall biosynthesis